MSCRLGKLVSKFLLEPHRVTLDDVDRVLRDFGWQLKKKPGSDFTYHKPGQYPITIVAEKHGSKRIRSKTVSLVAKHLDLEEWYESHSGT